MWQAMKRKILLPSLILWNAFLIKIEFRIGYVRKSVRKKRLLFFSINYIIIMKFTHTSRVHLSKSSDYFPQNLLHCQHNFCTFAWDAVCRSSKTLSWNVAALHATCVSARRRPQNGVTGVYPSGDQQDGSRRVLNRDCRGVWGEQCTSLLHLPPLCADRCVVWHCHAGGWVDPTFCVAEPFRIRCVHLFNL